MKGRYSYYRCRSRYVGREDSTCSSKYVRTDAIESCVHNAIVEVLANPDRILSEAKRLAEEDPGLGELTTVLAALREVEAKQRRLVRLFTDGDLPCELLDEQRSELSRRRTALEGDRTKLESNSRPSLNIQQVTRDLPQVEENPRLDGERRGREPQTAPGRGRCQDTNRGQSSLDQGICACLRRLIRWRFSYQVTNIGMMTWT